MEAAAEGVISPRGLEERRIRQGPHVFGEVAPDAVDAFGVLPRSPDIDHWSDVRRFLGRQSASQVDGDVANLAPLT